MKLILVPCLSGLDIADTALRLEVMFERPNNILCEATESSRVAARNAAEAIGRGVAIDNAGVIDEDRIRRELRTMSLQRGDLVVWAFVSRTGKVTAHSLDKAGELQSMVPDLKAIQVGVAVDKREQVA